MSPLITIPPPPTELLLPTCTRLLTPPSSDRGLMIAINLRFLHLFKRSIWLRGLLFLLLLFNHEQYCTLCGWVLDGHFACHHHHLVRYSGLWHQSRSSEGDYHSTAAAEIYNQKLCHRGAISNGITTTGSGHLSSDGQWVSWSVCSCGWMNESAGGEKLFPLQVGSWWVTMVWW